jgi:hypothetical protein
MGVSAQRAVRELSQRADAGEAAKELRRPKWERQYFSPNAKNKITCYELVVLVGEIKGFPDLTSWVIVASKLLR